MNRIFLLSVAAATLAACSSKEKQPEVPDAASSAPPAASIEAKQVAAQQGSSYVTEFKYSPKAKALPQEAKKKLAKLLADAGADKNTKIDAVKIISWPDREYPSVHTEDLPKADVDLAEARAKEISKWLEKKNVEDVEIVNMAKRPSGFASFFNSEDHRIKKALEESGIPNTDTSVKRPSKKGHVIVIALTEKDE